IILKVIDAIMGLRVDEEAEVAGLDLNLHGESVQ
ncbi:MAG TPA: ammonium transporter, partial [Alphaproteobacteria bacterium]|nr:ammonium transporter [Alphaproteobacteria bacterium]